MGTFERLGNRMHQLTSPSQRAYRNRQQIILLFLHKFGKFVYPNARRTIEHLQESGNPEQILALKKLHTRLYLDICEKSEASLKRIKTFCQALSALSKIEPVLVNDQIMIAAQADRDRLLSQVANTGGNVETKLGVTAYTLSFQEAPYRTDTHRLPPALRPPIEESLATVPATDKDLSQALIIAQQYNHAAKVRRGSRIYAGLSTAGGIMFLPTAWQIIFTSYHSGMVALFTQDIASFALGFGQLTLCGLGILAFKEGIKSYLDGPKQKHQARSEQLATSLLALPADQAAQVLSLADSRKNVFNTIRKLKPDQAAAMAEHLPQLQQIEASSWRVSWHYLKAGMEYLTSAFKSTERSARLASAEKRGQRWLSGQAVHNETPRLEAPKNTEDYLR